MKVLFPLIQAGSGADVFTHNLVSGLKQSSLAADIQHLPGWSGYIPPIMGKLCNSEGYDIIHSNLWNGFAFAGLKPVVATSHSAVRLPELKKYQSLSQKIFYRLVSRWEKSTLNSADTVCCVSKFAAQYLERMYGYSDTKIVYNGVNTNIFCPKIIEDNVNLKHEKSTIKLFFSGNTRLMKGFDLIPVIMKQLGNGYSLTLASGLRNQKKRNYQYNIVDLGRVEPNQMPQFYRDTDIFLFPTRLEGFSLTVLEAMSCGNPIVTTNTSSLPEQVIDGKGGFLCEMDNVKDFAESIRIIAEDSSLRREMGRFNRERVIAKFSLERMVQEYIKVYKKL